MAKQENPPSPEKDFDQMLEESLMLLKEFLDNMEKAPLNPNIKLDEIEKKLRQMDREMSEFLEVSKRYFEGFLPDETGQIQVPKSTLRLLKKSEELKKRAEGKLFEAIETERIMKDIVAKEGSPAPAKSEKPGRAKEASQKRKLRRMGKRDWKPL